MGFLTAAVVAVAALAVLNLVLTLGVVRRLREHSQQLGRLAVGGLSGLGGPGEELILPVGERPDEFTAHTVDGGEVSLASLRRPAMVGFFSPDCPPCTEWIPRFVAAASRSAREQALAVVVADGAEAVADVARLRDVAAVVVEPVDGPVAKAFAVRGFPALCTLAEDGTVLANEAPAVVGSPSPE